ncbi:hypothetical protein GM921_15545 [Pedobacter sp. LMG 31464]|uniref:DUF1579 domain-containing protein n=1 Tax=Pedobacter planticolens TaxID=2679964 RepID=A0A923E1Z3_9SPHI|nr:hypothetical protein [Pedobacter planticolens]MBB2146918.1 hypothetical protein [Pedobacter planticolens]
MKNSQFTNEVFKIMALEKTFIQVKFNFIVSCFFLTLLPTFVIAQSISGKNGQRDFDFEIGDWKTKLKVLKNPLSGSTTWVEYEGTSKVIAICNGNSNLVELNVKGSGGQIIGVSLRLFNPKTNQWSLNFANIKDGNLATPSIGSFKDGRGEFFNEDTFDGKKILVRFVISAITPSSCHFEQAFSTDNGKTWEVNWIAEDTRIKS